MCEITEIRLHLSQKNLVSGFWGELSYIILSVRHYHVAKYGSCCIDKITFRFKITVKDHTKISNDCLRESIHTSKSLYDYPGMIVQFIAPMLSPIS